MSDIVEELRKDCEFGPDYPLDPESFVCHRIECKAADEIERLRAEIARLREERREVAWGVMFPDGDVIPFEERKEAEQAVKSANERIAMAGGSLEDRLRMVALSIQPPPEDQ